MDHASPDERSSDEPFDGVRLTELTAGDRANVNYVEIAPGAEVPMHSHANEQHGFVHEGRLTFTFEDGSDRTIAAGEGYVLDPDEPHRAVNRGDETVVAIDVFSPPRRGPPEE